jgi:hypothetical protein
MPSFIGLFYQPWMIDGDDYGAVNGMSGWETEIFRGNVLQCRCMHHRSQTIIDRGSNPGLSQ